MRTDRQTDMTKLTVTFRKLANAPKTVHLYICTFRTTAIASLNVINWSVSLVEAKFILWQVGTEQHAENLVNFLSHPMKLLRYSSKLGHGRYFPEYWKHTHTHTHTHIFLYIFDIFINGSWVVTRWQYTFTHKQYIEQHK